MMNDRCYMGTIAVGNKGSTGLKNTLVIFTSDNGCSPAAEYQ